MTVEELADKFISAGKGFVEITDEYLELAGIIGKPGAKRVPKYAKKNWETFCRWVYKQITKQEMEACRLRGQGFRSQWHARKVAEALKESNVVGF